MLLPLALSAEWVQHTEETQARGRGAGSCRFCGHAAAGWQERFGVKDGRAGKSKDGTAAACAFCHLVRHIERPEIDREAVLIWSPELTQAALNRIAWRIFEILAAHGLAPDAEAGAAAGEAPARAASLRDELRALSAAAEREAGTCAPSELAEVFLGLRRGREAWSAPPLGGLRLWPLGRLFIDGRDVLPSLLGIQKD